MRILLVGDLHGAIAEFSELLQQIRSRFRIAAVIQVGDFGFFEKTFVAFKGRPLRFGVPVHVIDGNHEDHAWLWRCEKSGISSKWKEEANLYYQPRGSVQQFGSSAVGFLGGALNLDRPQQQDPKSDSSNYIRADDVLRAVSAFNEAGVDLVISHTCPSGIGIGLCCEPSFKQGMVNFVVSVGLDPGDDEDSGDVQLTMLWEKLKNKPAAWVFGHFHREHEAWVSKTHFRCLGQFRARERTPLVIWDTEERGLVSIDWDA